jgi:hypothetical protein
VTEDEMTRGEGQLAGAALDLGRRISLRGALGAPQPIRDSARSRSAA